MSNFQPRNTRKENPLRETLMVCPPSTNRLPTIVEANEETPPTKVEEDEDKGPPSTIVAETLPPAPPLNRQLTMAVPFPGGIDAIREGLFGIRGSCNRIPDEKSPPEQ